MVRFADAAGVERRSGHRERDGNEGSGEREQEQESGDQALHGFV